MLRRFGVAAAGPQLLRLCRGAPACAADHRKSAFAASRPRHDGGLGVLLLDGYSCLRSRLVCRPHFFLNCQNRLSEQANYSKLKVEVCVRTGTKFVSEQGLGTPQRESVALALGRTCCVCVESVRGSEGDFKTGRGKERGNWERQSP